MRAELLEWDGTVFAGRHHGYERLPEPATHERRIELHPGRLVVRDTVRSDGAHDLEWTFPLAPGAEPLIEAPGLDFAAVPGWYAPRYGERVPTTFLRARRRSRPGEDVTEIVLRPG
jgi:hypothetical protein